MKGHNKVVFFFPVLLVVLFTLMSCSKQQINSHWVVKDITIDGNAADWGNNIQYLKKKDIGIGIANDDSNFYFCAITSDRDLRRQILFRGLELWLDANGGKSKDFGIKFPLGIISMDPSMRRELFQGRRGRSQNQPPDFGQFISKMTLEFAVMGKDAASDNLPIHTDRPVQVRLPVYHNNRGIDLKLNLNGDQLVYEGKIPFKEFENSRKPRASTIGIGIQLPEMERRNGRDFHGGMRGGRPGGDFGGGGMRPPGGMSGGGPGGMHRPEDGGQRGDFQSMQKSLEFWGKVKLAKQG